MKKYKYTFLSLMFAVLFVIGSMAVANIILRHRETQLLTERGGIKVESPVREWEGRRNGDGSNGDTDSNNKKKSISVKDIEESVKSWINRNGVP